MTDTPDGAALPQAMLGVPVDATTNVGGVSSSLTVEPWTPDHPLRADATREQFRDRLDYHGRGNYDPSQWEETDWLTVREYADAVATQRAINVETAILRWAGPNNAEERIAAAESALAEARAEVRRLSTPTHMADEDWEYTYEASDFKDAMDGAYKEEVHPVQRFHRLPDAFMAWLPDDHGDGDWYEFATREEAEAARIAALAAAPEGGTDG